MIEAADVIFPKGGETEDGGTLNDIQLRPISHKYYPY